MGTSKFDELTAWRELARAEVERAQSDLAEAQRRADATRERLGLLDRLLALEQSGPVDESSTGGLVSVRNAIEEPPGLLDSCERIIRDRGQPVHISELLPALNEAGVAIPGRGTDANVIVRLRRAPDRFVRTGRGMYALPEFGLHEAPTKRKKKRRRTAAARARAS